MVKNVRKFGPKYMGLRHKRHQSWRNIFITYVRPHLRSMWAIHSELLVCCWFSSCYLQC